MDRFGYSATSLDELKQIQNEVSAAHSQRHLRGCFERVQELKRIHSGNFDVQLLVAETQDAIITRARELQRNGTHPGDEEYFEEPTHAGGAAPALEEQPNYSAAAGQEEGKRNWRLATFLALGLTAIICIVFFFLIQLARRSNFPEENAPAPKAVTAPVSSTPPGNKPLAPAAPVSTTPTVRLYTDLIPGTVSIDDGAPKDLTDGELVLDQLAAGPHSIKVNGKSGSAEFNFNISPGAAPQASGAPTANNALALVVSAQDGKGRVLSSAPDATISLNGKPLGATGANGLELSDLGTSDHDLQVAQNGDTQRFVMTYTPTPVMTVYVKSVVSLGTVTVATHQDGVNVYVQDKLYRRKTDRGEIRIPLKVGTYSIRVQKDGFIDPPPQTAEVKKGDEIKLDFSLEPVPTISTLAVNGAAPGTTVWIDGAQAGTVNAQGQAMLGNVKPGEHVIELRADGYVTKRSTHLFQAGSGVTLSGADVTLQKVPVESKPEPAPPAPVEAPPAAKPVDIPGEQVRHGPGFVHYNLPRSAGHYFFEAHSKIGGVFKREKLQWYAGYKDSANYVLFSLDGKHASIRKMTDGHVEEIGRVPFNATSEEWVQVDMVVNAEQITARVRTPGDGWTNMGTVAANGGDFTQGQMGFYLPGNDEVTVANFRFTAK